MACREEPITHEVKKELLRKWQIFSSIVFDVSGLDIDLIEAAAKKLDESHSRYPVEKARGSSKKYTELT